MPPRKTLDLRDELIESFDHALRVTEYLIETLPDGIWRTPPPSGDGRSIAAIVSHMANLKRSFAKMGTGAPPCELLEGARVTRAEAIEAFSLSREALVALFRDTLAEEKGRVKGLPRRVVNMIFYLTQHDAHHRGQITRQARELGHRASEEEVMRVWGWKKLP